MLEFFKNLIKCHSQPDFPANDSGFEFGARSRRNMQGVHPDLCKVARLALKRSRTDFGITSGIRSSAEQKSLFDAGKSKCDGITSISPHQQGLALDVVAYSAGKVSWDFGLYVEIADAFRSAAIETGIVIKWGGGWRILNSMPRYKLGSAAEAYRERCRDEGRAPLIDGPHFELVQGSVI